jgi:hypothetical protein
MVIQKDQVRGIKVYIIPLPRSLPPGEGSVNYPYWSLIGNFENLI